MTIPKTKEEWYNIIDDNAMTDSYIDRIVENEILRNNLIELRDREKALSVVGVIDALIELTKDLK